MSTPTEPLPPNEASMPVASEPSSPLPIPNPSQLVTSPQSGRGARSLLAVLLPIVLMVLSLGGIGATLAWANHQSASVTQGAGRFPGQYGQRPSGFPTGGRVRPSGFPTDGTMPSGFPTDGTMPSGFPTDGNVPSGFPSRGSFPGNGQRQPGQRPAGGGGVFQGNGARPGMHLTGVEIGLISGLGVVFVGSGVFLVVALVNRRKTPATAGVPTQLPSGDHVA